MHKDQLSSSSTQQYIGERIVERDYDLNVAWLRKRRRQGLPPKYYRIPARMIRYKRADIEAFLQASVVEPTRGAE
jgi:hypothetical protein